MRVQHVQAAAARVQQAAWLGARLGQQRLGQQRLGQPAGRPGVGRAAVAAAGGRGQLPARLVRAAEAQRDPPGQQMGRGCFGRAQRVELPGQLAGRAEQRRGDPALGEPRAEHTEPGLGLPAFPALGPEQAAGGLGPGQGHLGLPGGERRGRRGQQQLRLLGELAAGRLDIGDRLLGLRERVAGQAGREQHRAPVQVEVGQRDHQRRIAPGRIIQAAQSGGEIAQAEGDDGPVVHQVRGFQLIAGPGEQPLSRAKIIRRPPDAALGQVDQGPGGQRPARPRGVPGPAQRGHRLVQVAERLGVTAQGPQDDGPALPDLGRADAAGLPPRLVERGEPGAGPARVDQRDPEGGADVRLAGGGPGLPGGPQPGLQFAPGRGQVAELTQHHPGGLVRDGGVQRRGPAREDGAGAGQSFPWPGGREDHQLRHVRRFRGLYLAFTRHGADARGVPCARPSLYGAPAFM